MKNLRWKIAQEAEKRWWKNYLMKKNPSEYLPWKKKYWNAFLEENIGLSSYGTILDAGCGPAGIFIIFQHEITALDPLLSAYEEQQDFFQRKNYPNVKFLEQTLEENIEGIFDTIFCINAINHVSNLETCLKNLHSSLRPDGKMFLTTDAHRHEWLKPFFRIIPGDILHPYQWSNYEYKEALENAGFKIDDTKLLKREKIFDYIMYSVSKS
jgi:2-polyprenyl-3-methyl-5-hydroxy-6-metoxy-1,4-benzoquinol methylase